MKHRNTIPIKPKYRKDEVVSNVKETAITQMVKHSLDILRRRVGDIHNTESTYPATLDPKYITDLSRAIGGMHHITPPLDDAKMLAYTPYLYMKLKDSTYNVIPHPDQQEKCSVGCIYDRYDQVTLEMKCAKNQPSSVYRTGGADPVICQNNECQFWSGKKSTVHDVADVPDNVKSDTLHKYKVVFPVEQRMVPHSRIKYYEDCGTAFGEPERGDAEYYNEGDCTVTGDIYDPSDTYACQTGGKYVWYKFGSEDDQLSKNDAVYYLVMEFPGLGDSLAVTVEVSPDSTNWHEITGSPFSVSSTSPTMYQYEIPEAYYGKELYVRFRPGYTDPVAVTNNNYIPGWSIDIDSTGRFMLFATCWPQTIGEVYPSYGTYNIYIYDLQSTAANLSDRYVRLTNITDPSVDVQAFNAKFNPTDSSEILLCARWSSWDGSTPNTNQRSDIWRTTISITYDAQGNMDDAELATGVRLISRPPTDCSANDWCPNGLNFTYVYRTTTGSACDSVADPDYDSSCCDEIYLAHKMSTDDGYKLTDHASDSDTVWLVGHPHWHPTSVDASGRYNKLLYPRFEGVRVIDWGSATTYHYEPDYDTGELYEITIYYNADGSVDESATQSQTPRRMTYAPSGSTGAHQWGVYSHDGEHILFDSRREGRTGAVSGVLDWDYYIIQSSVPENGDLGGGVLNRAVRVTRDDMGDSQWGIWSHDDTSILMQSTGGDSWYFDGKILGDGVDYSAEAWCPAKGYYNRYNFYQLSLEDATGGFVSQLWLLEAINQRHYNYGEQLLLPKYLSRVTPCNEYPKNAMFLYDSVAGTTLDHIKFFSSYFNYFEDSEKLHRDCVDVFVYNDQELEASDVRYLVYTAGTSLADVAGGLLDDYINHVNDEDMHLTSEDVCRLINDPTLCCKYDNNTADVTFNNSIGVELRGKMLADGNDTFESGEVYLLRALPFGQNIPDDVTVKWYVTPPGGGFGYVNSGGVFRFRPTTIGTYTISAQIVVSLGGSHNTVRATESFSVYVGPNTKPVDAEINGSCMPADPQCCFDGTESFDYVSLRFQRGGTCHLEPTSTDYTLPDLSAGFNLSAKYGTPGDLVGVDYQLYVYETDLGTGVRTRRNLTPVDSLEWTNNDMPIESYTRVGWVVAEGDSTCPSGCYAPYEGVPIGKVGWLNGKIIYGEFTFYTRAPGSQTRKTEQVHAVAWHLGLSWTYVETPQPNWVIETYPTRTVDYSTGHTYTNPGGQNYNTVYLASQIPNTDITMCGLYYGFSTPEVGLETVVSPLFVFTGVSGLYELTGDEPWENLEDALLFLNVTGYSGGSWYSGLSNPSHRQLIVDIFDYSFLDMRWSQHYHNLTLTCPPWSIAGITPYTYNGQTYNSEACIFCHTAVSNTRLIPDPDTWVGNDTDNSHARSFNFYPIHAGWDACGMNCDACYTEGAYKRGSGYYSLATLRPCRYTDNYGSSEPQFGQTLGDKKTFFTRANPVTVQLAINNGAPVGKYFVNITQALRQMLKPYYNSPGNWNKTDRIGVRIRNPFPYNATTAEDRYVIFGNSMCALGLTYS